LLLLYQIYIVAIESPVEFGDPVFKPDDFFDIDFIDGSDIGFGRYCVLRIG